MRFSVIVPIYKVEKYLCECIDSVLAQTCTDFELILVDDGSPDDCGKICDEYRKKDSRISVIHKENGGLVSARKAGIKAAVGQYVVNLDGDDKLAPQMLELANEAAQKTNADLISFAIEFFEENFFRKVFENLPSGVYNKNRIQDVIYPKMLMNENMEHSFYYLCGKAIKRSVLTEPQLAVSNSISLGEDVSCLMGVYARCDSAFVSENIGYLCRCRRGSDSRSFRPIQIFQLNEGLKHLEKMTIDKCDDFAAQTDRYAAFICFGILNAAADEKKKLNLGEIDSEIRSGVIAQHAKRAKFGKVSPKMRMVYYLMRKEKFKSVYRFLKICNFIKGVFKCR